MAEAAKDSILPSGNALIDGLLQGGSWESSPGVVAHSLTYSLNINDDGSTPPNPDPLGGTWTPAWINAAAAAFTTWSNVANISFVLQPNPVDNSQYYFQSPADISLTRTGDDLQVAGIVAIGLFPDPDYVNAIVFFPGSGITRADYPKPEGDIALDNAFEGFQDQYLNAGGWGFHTFIHEIGHALGLKHSFDDGGNGRPTFTDLGIGAFEDPLWTVMTYDPENPPPLAVTGFAATPMPLDILAIQYIYGANMSYHAGDDSGINAYFLADDGVVKTIWDAGGNDTIDASGLGFGISLDLSPGAFTSHGVSAITAIAYNVTIENAIGTAFNDTITGNDAVNVLTGQAGDDVYIVQNAGDTVVENVSEGTDAVQSSVSFALPANVEQLYLLGVTDIDGTGNALANVIVGNLGVNVLIGGVGDDVYIVQNEGDSITENAGEGVDTVLSSVTFALGANVENLTLQGAGHLSAIGNELDNTLVGNAGFNVLAGGVGNDTYVVQNVEDVVAESPGAGADIVTSSVDFTLPEHVEHIFLLGFGNINATGNELQNVIVGNLGANTLAGLGGDDIYFVQAPGANIVESAGQGRDTVFSFLSFGLADNVEDLFLQGGADLYAIGNALDNVLLGNAGNNLLDGGTGADEMRGGAGDDAYVVDHAGDSVIENVAEGTDTVLSAVSYSLAGSEIEHVTLTGNADINATGNGFNNTLVGNAGINLLSGGAGDDTYVVQNSADTIVENAVEGTDTVTAEASFVLPANVEHIFLLGLGNLNATGNELQNVLVGNLGTNMLTGGGGDDIYFVQAPNATVVENADEGRDTVFAYLNFTLSDNVEDLYLEGTNPVDGTGNALSNVLRGNSAANVLTPGAGTDILIGAGDNDTFVFDATSGMNRIVDFADGASGEEDTVNLAAFTTNFGSLNFTVEAGGVAMTVAGVADFSVFFEGYTDTASFGAEDFFFA